MPTLARLVWLSIDLLDVRLLGLLADLEGGTPGPQDLEREDAEAEDFLEFIIE